MRLEKFNRLRSIAMTSAVVTTLMGITGCKTHTKPAPQQPISRPVTLPDQTPIPATTLPTTVPATLPTAGPVEIPATLPATLPATPPVPPVVIPVAPPVTQPVAEPVTQPTTEPATQPATQPVEPPIKNAVRPEKPADIAADQTLAEQLAGVAELQFLQKVNNPAEWPLIWHHQAAMLSAAAELDFKEPRYSRLAADAMAQAHDRKGEEAALRQAVVTDRSDEVSFIRLMDLYLQDMPELNQRMDYLKDVVNTVATPAVPADVVAHAQYRLALELKDHGEDGAADAALKQGLRVCPSSLECLRLQYMWLAPDATTYESAEHLLAILKANPLLQSVSSQLADMISDAGLARDSLPFYRLAVQTARGQGGIQHPMLGWAAAMFINDPGSNDPAVINRRLLSIDPNFTPAYFLQLVLTKYSGDKDAYKKTMSEAGNALGNRVVDAINKALPTDTNKPTTRPINDPEAFPLPDLTPAVTQLKQNGSQEQKEEFAEAVADLAFLQGYFAQKPDDSARLIAALQQLLPEDSPELVRLQGWNDLLNNRPDDAKAKFLTVLNKDPLAQLGLLKITIANGDAKQKMDAESEARKLLADHPAGLIGAILYAELRSERVKLFPKPQAAALDVLVNNFPPSLFLAAEKPNNLYAIRVTPHNVGSYFSDSLLAEVKIENISNFDLTIGPDGLIKPELIFTLTPNLAKDQTSKFEAFESIAGPVVLPPRSGTKQIVRLDQTQFLAFLDRLPNRYFNVSASVATNNTAGGLGQVQAMMDKDFLRYASVLNAENQTRALSDLATGRPEQKIAAINQLELFTLEIRSIKPKPGQTAPDPRGLVQEIHRARNDDLKAVSAWAAKAEFELSNDPIEESLIINDLADDQDWRHRQIALLLSGAVPPATRDRLLEAMKNDPQASVRAEARALLGRASVPSTMPSTMPAIKPAH